MVDTAQTTRMIMTVNAGTGAVNVVLKVSGRLLGTGHACKRGS